MKRTHLSTASTFCGLFGILLAVTGCVSPTPRLDHDFGKSVSLLKAQQILNPEASRNTDPVQGMNGKAAKSGYDEYQKSYQAPAPLAPLSISIGK